MVELLRGLPREGDAGLHRRARAAVQRHCHVGVAGTLGYGEVATVHGFRSSFRDWGAECSHFPREVLEHALAHTVGDASERAYARSKLFGKRRLLMEAWRKYPHEPAGTRCQGRADARCRVMTRDQQIKTALGILKLPPGRREAARVNIEKALDSLDGACVFHGNEVLPLQNRDGSA